jgi:hypothetical protein
LPLLAPALGEAGGFPQLRQALQQELGCFPRLLALLEHVRQHQAGTGPLLRHLGPARKLRQTLLLRGLAGRLRGSNQFGAFASDTLMKLGLLGTIIGFIMMLAPIAGLDRSDRSTIRSSMNLMSDGMAVAMYTTLAGLVGSILVRIQYYMLDAATQKVFSDAVVLTETYVTPVLERKGSGIAP